MAATASTRSDSNGALLICPDRETHYLAPIVLAHREFTWSVCVFHDDRWRIVHRGAQYTLVATGPTSSVELQCSIDEEGPTCSPPERPNVLPLAAIVGGRCDGLEPAG
jgi:hypothetical protein